MTAGQGGNTADVMAQALAGAGVRSIFGYPGDPIIEFMERSRLLGVDVVLARREASAAFMAEASAMSTGGIGVCLSTLGPGSTALVNGVAAANLDRVPMVAISGQIETARQAFFTHQVVEHERLYSPVTKWAGRVEANAVATTMRKALRVATAERPGAVHLSCAADTFKATASDADVVTPPLGGTAGNVRVYSAPGATSGPHAVLAKAKRPLLLVGIGAVRCEATASIVRLAETVGMPVVVAPMAKGVVPEDSDWFAGTLDMACNKTVWDFVRSSDLVVAAGFDPVELIKPWHVPVPVLHVDTVPNVDQVYASDVELVGDVAASLDWLAEEFGGEQRWLVDDVRAHRARLRDEYYAGRVEGRLNPTDVVDVASASAPPGTLVTSDVGSHKLLVGQGWQALEPRSVLMTNGLSAMGFGLPGAIAAKLTRPDRPAMALIGDGGFAMTATEIRLAASRGLGMAVVVFVDGSLNRIELKQAALGYPSTATRIDDVDLVAMAGAMGCDGARAESVAELEKCLGGIGDLERPLIVEARIDPSQYESQF
ncbi:MAG: thiamine pyrophosphate-binding protein [Streptosporangiales bacterium]|nr:thiamine pyrophosphate-binding protein [Streptosporangiales bacterium]MBO0890450.1 thiamine pyrophosphate-binding protein [Acidothermales bacterium]